MGEKLIAEFERYNNLDGLRTISCIGIIGMHIAANSKYRLNDWFGQQLVPSFNWLVFLFIMISGFGMFNGYYERIKNGEVDFNTFCKVNEISFSLHGGTMLGAIREHSFTP